MIIKREALATVLPATTFANDTHGYALTSINVEPSGRLAATDGHICVTVTDVQPFADADFPVQDIPAFHASPAKSVRIPADIAKRLIGAMPKSTPIPILKCAQLSTKGSPETCTIAATDLSAPTAVTLRDDGKSFPDVDRVLSQTGKGPMTRVSLALPVLETMIKAAKAATAGTKSDPVIYLDIPTTEGEVVLSGIAFSVPGAIRNGLEVSGVAMPCRIK